MFLFRSWRKGEESDHAWRDLIETLCVSRVIPGMTIAETSWGRPGAPLPDSLMIVS